MSTQSSRVVRLRMADLEVSKPQPPAAPVSMVKAALADATKAVLAILGTIVLTLLFLFSLPWVARFGGSMGLGLWGIVCLFAVFFAISLFDRSR